MNQNTKPAFANMAEFFSAQGSEYVCVSRPAATDGTQVAYYVPDVDTGALWQCPIIRRINGTSLNLRAATPADWSETQWKSLPHKHFTDYAGILEAIAVTRKALKAEPDVLFLAKAAAGLLVQKEAARKLLENDVFDALLGRQGVATADIGEITIEHMDKIDRRLEDKLARAVPA